MRIAAKKRFGQHFLRDTGILERIVRLIRPEPEDVIIEVGAGDGALSTRLAQAVAALLAIELDADCLVPLNEALSPFPAAHVLPGDFLSLDLEDIVGSHLRPGNRLRAVGNLPYNVATPVIRKCLDTCLPVADMVFMLQLEVAERITASPGSRQYGLLSVLCQHLCEVRLAFKVSPACFVPRPKVMSAVIEMHPRGGPRNPEFEASLVELAKAAFGHRRKTLANSLRYHPTIGPRSAALLAAAGIDGARRPEDVSVKEYEHLSEVQLRILGLGPEEPSAGANP